MRKEFVFYLKNKNQFVSRDLNPFQIQLSNELNYIYINCIEMNSFRGLSAKCLLIWKIIQKSNTK